MSRTTRTHCKKGRYDIYCGRPGPFGNQYSHRAGTLAKYRVSTQNEAVEKHLQDLLADPVLLAKVRKELTGKILGCWCDDSERCHCDNYIRVCDE